MTRTVALRPAWMEKPNPLVRALKAVGLGISVVLVLIPFWTVVATSLADDRTINAAGGGMVIWPSHPTLHAYTSVLGGTPVVVRALVVSVVITVTGTLLSLAATAGLAYWLSRPNALLRKPVLLLVLGAVLFSPGLIPSFLMVKSLGLLDSYWALILPAMMNAFNVIVMRSFFMDLPQELFESAALDGASSANVLFRIVLPLSKAVLAVIGLFYAVGYWNAFFNAVLYIKSTEKWPIALVLRSYVVQQSPVGLNMPTEAIPPQMSLQMAILVIAILPILLVYPFLQKHFAKGVMIGAVKG